jgi:uncharacterized membrane protein
VTIYVMSIFVFYLSIFSFAGWIAEVIFVFATTRQLENRGFLTGPILPIYGVGGILLIVFVQPYVHNPFLVYVASVLITSALEYVTHLILDRVFHLQLWDYSAEPLNLRGRICLRNSLLFGVLGLLLIYVLFPLVTTLIEVLPAVGTIAIASALLGILIVDTSNSVISLAKIRPMVDRIKGNLLEVHARIEAEAENLAEARTARKRRLSRTQGKTVDRLGRVYPNAHSTHPHPSIAVARPRSSP